MLKNLKKSIVFILIVIMLLLVVFISLAASKPASQIDVKDTSVSVYAGINTGLGVVLYYSQVDSYIDTLLANGLTDLRIDIPDYQNTSWLTQSKAAVIRAVAKGARVIWGISSNAYNNVSYTLTAENWAAYRQEVLDAAGWAQNNGVYEFQLGNEAEYHNHFHCAVGTMVRTSNVVTVTTPAPHGFDGNHQVTVLNAAPENMQGTFDITVTGATTFTYVAPGANGSNNYPGEIYTLTRPALRANLKSLATEVQAIFTRGNISYSCSGGLYPPAVDEWIADGKGDIDIIAVNTYLEHPNWQTCLTDLVNAFGVDGTYVSEFAPSANGISSYSADESEQAVATADMSDSIKASGMKRAIWYALKNDAFGAIKDDGTYRLLWNALTTSNNRNTPPAVSNLNIQKIILFYELIL